MMAPWALPLIKQFFENYKDTFKPKYYAMDSAYDLDYVYKTIINEYQGIPIIAYNPGVAMLRLKD